MLGPAGATPREVELLDPIAQLIPLFDPNHFTPFHKTNPRAWIITHILSRTKRKERKKRKKRELQQCHNIAMGISFHPSTIQKYKVSATLHCGNLSLLKG